MTAAGAPSGPGGPGRCRCGHFATDHMVVEAVPEGGGFRLAPTGPCRRCGASVCRAMVPAPA